MGKVYVLGAGASRALNSGAPFMADLLQTALKFSSDTREGMASKPRADSVSAFISTFYHGDLSEALPPFEDVLSQLDFCIVNNIPLSQSYSVERLRQLRKDLIYIMGRVIQVNTQNRTDEGLAGTFMGHIAQHEDCIISLNYDLIADNAERRRGTGACNYGIPTRNLEGTGLNFKPSSIVIYKLHGSLNWLYCPVCRKLETTDSRKEGLEALIADISCRECQTLLEPVLITPSFLKDYNNSFLVQLWREAQLRLHYADEVIFVGYSMPDADIVLRLFFTRALFTNRLINKRACIVRVVDLVRTEEYQQPKKPSEVEARYRQLFGNIDYDASGFKEYILRGCRTVKQL